MATRKMKKFITVLLAAMLVSAFATYVQAADAKKGDPNAAKPKVEGEKKMGQARMGDGMRGGEGRMAMLTKQLNLTEDQQKAIMTSRVEMREILGSKLVREIFLK